jgi:hypothetical protein
MKARLKTDSTAVFGSGWGWLAQDGHKLTIITTSGGDGPLTKNLTADRHRRMGARLLSRLRESPRRPYSSSPGQHHQLGCGREPTQNLMHLQSREFGRGRCSVDRADFNFIEASNTPELGSAVFRAIRRLLHEAPPAGAPALRPLSRVGSVARPRIRGQNAWHIRFTPCPDRQRRSRKVTRCSVSATKHSGHRRFDRATRV